MHLRQIFVSTGLSDDSHLNEYRGTWNHHDRADTVNEHDALIDRFNCRNVREVSDGWVRA